MSDSVDLYNTYYGHLTDDPQAAVRRETYGEDLGQSSWITLAEALEWFALLALAPERRALEVACGSGGVTLRMARETGATCIGVDINAHGINSANALAAASGLAGQLTFDIVNAGIRLPFQDAEFDAVFCNDAILHLPDRLRVLEDWYRILKPGGRVLFTDPIIVTGQLTHEEIRSRSSIGFFVFTPLGTNEQLLERAGFRLLEVRNVTTAVMSVAARWHEARLKRRKLLVQHETDAVFDGIQAFLETVHCLAAEQRLSRYMFLAEKPGI